MIKIICNHCARLFSDVDVIKSYDRELNLILCPYCETVLDLDKLEFESDMIKLKNGW